jgi:hypothetical protein
MYEGVPSAEGGDVARGLGNGEGAGCGTTPATRVPEGAVTVKVVCPGPATPETTSIPAFVGTLVAPLAGYASVTAGTTTVLQIELAVAPPPHPAVSMPTKVNPKNELRRRLCRYDPRNCFTIFPPESVWTVAPEMLNYISSHAKQRSSSTFRLQAGCPVQVQPRGGTGSAWVCQASAGRSVHGDIDQNPVVRNVGVVPVCASRLNGRAIHVDAADVGQGIVKASVERRPFENPLRVVSDVRCSDVAPIVRRRDVLRQILTIVAHAHLGSRLLRNRTENRIARGDGEVIQFRLLGVADGSLLIAAGHGIEAWETQRRNSRWSTAGGDYVALAFVADGKTRSTSAARARGSMRVTALSDSFARLCSPCQNDRACCRGGRFACCDGG